MACQGAWEPRIASCTSIDGREMEGLNQALREAECTTRRGKGRTAQVPRRAEAERWSSTRSGRKTEEIQCLLLLGSTYRATQRSLGLARCRRRGLIAACRNITRRRHRPHASLCSVIAPRCVGEHRRTMRQTPGHLVFVRAHSTTSRSRAVRCCCGAQYHHVARIC